MGQATSSVCGDSHADVTVSPSQINHVGAGHTTPSGVVARNLEIILKLPSLVTPSITQ